MTSVPVNRHGFVLVHGSGHTSAIWEPLLPFLACPGVVVDLPGRRGRAGDLATLQISDFANAVVEDIEASDLDTVVLVGHSLAGLTLPLVAQMLPERVPYLVYVACTLPSVGKSLADDLPLPYRAIIRRQVRQGIMKAPSLAAARRQFCNGMNKAQEKLVFDNLVPEAGRVMTEPVGRRPPVQSTYVRLLRDRTLSQRTQRRQMANLVDRNVVALDAGHDAMVSHPKELAVILNGIIATFITDIVDGKSDR